MKRTQFFVIFCIILSAKTLEGQMVTSICSDTVEVNHFASGLGLRYLYTDFTYIDAEGDTFEKWVEYPHPHVESKSKIVSFKEFEKISSTHDLLSVKNLDQTLQNSPERVDSDTLFVEKSDFCYHDFVYDDGKLHVFLVKTTRKYFSPKRNITLREVKKVVSYDTSLRYDIASRRYVSTQKFKGQFWSIPSQSIKIIRYAEKLQLPEMSELTGIKSRG